MIHSNLDRKLHVCFYYVLIFLEMIALLLLLMKYIYTDLIILLISDEKEPG